MGQLSLVGDWGPRFSASFKGPQGITAPHLAQRPPCCPSPPRGQRVWYRLVQARVKEAKKLTGQGDW